MDNTQMTALMSTGTGGTIITMVYFFYKTFIGKKCRSRCCGQDIEMGMVVEEMTPSNQHTEQRFVVNNPLPLSAVVP
jgi:hypothetical protein